MFVIYEHLGSRPKWMKIKGYREGRTPSGNRRAELLLELRKKTYWFPVTPFIYSRFESIVKKDSRSKGLRYLQKYIRSRRGYKNRWPSKRYTKLNKLPKGKSFLNESVVDQLIDKRLMELEASDGSAREFTNIQKYTKGPIRFVRVAKQKARSKRLALTPSSFSK